MDERMTICNMSIEGGARVGYVNPDQTTFDYLRGRRFAPQGDAFDAACAWWQQHGVRSRTRATTTRSTIDAAAIRPTVTWGINPGQSVGVDEPLPDARRLPADRARRRSPKRSTSWGFSAGQPIAGTQIDVAFIGSCTNGRLSDLREAARVVRGRHVAPHVRALVVPGSQPVRRRRSAKGSTRSSSTPGFEWRGAGCSMCLAMNPDKLEGREICASSSNRNFKGRQGSPTGRTLLMSPAMVAAAAVAGEVVDVREIASMAIEQDPTQIAGRARCRCAATTSTPIGSSRRGFCKSVTFEGLETAPVRGRSAAARGRRAAPSVRRSALHGRVDPARQRATSAAARRASTRRRRSAAAASARSSASRSPRSSSATPSRSACRA